MINKNKFVLLIFCFLIFVCISSVCAEDNANVTVSHFQVADVSVSDAATFDDLQNDIKSLNPGDVYNMDKDCIFDSGIENGPKIIFGQKGIEIGVDNVTINGNGHVIDGNYQTAIFKVTGNNVKICNLTFINAKYSGWEIPLKSKEYTESLSHLVVKVTDDMSAVCWMGDNGLIDDCIFSYNAALNGGAIKWSGNNGVINNSLFINNIARGVGGAIYVAGANVTVANTLIINSTSLLTGESVYLDLKSKNFTHFNCTTDNLLFLIDGNYSGIDVDNYLKYTYYSYVGDKYTNVLPLMYQAIMFGFINIDDEISTCAQYINNTGDFTFSLMKTLREDGFLYQKDYLFKNTTLNDAFEHLINENYHNKVVMARNVNVTNKGTYDFVLRTNSDTLIKKVQQFMDMVDPDIKDMRKDKDKFSYDKDVSMALNVFLEPGIVIRSDAQWRQSNSFDIVNIFGNGAKIVASSEDRDENKWIVTAPNQVYTVYDLKIEGFNNAVYNVEGYCVFNNVIFNDNHMKYIFERDDGAAIVNGGVVICNNCTFTNNYAKNGGAIFNQGLLTLDNCTFKGNNGYGIGDNVLNVDKGIVVVNGENIKGSKGAVSYVESISSFVSTFTTVLAVVCSALAGVGSAVIGTILTGDPAIGCIIGVCVGGVVGGIFGVYAACTIAPRQYNLCFDRIATASSLIKNCIVIGMFSGLIAGSILAPFLGGNVASGDEVPIESEIQGIQNEELLPVEEPGIGEQLELNTEFWGPINSNRVPVVENPEMPAIENPEIPVENPKIPVENPEMPAIENPKIPVENPKIPVESSDVSQEGYLKIKNFDKLDFATRAKFSRAINSGGFFSFDVDCYDCTCKDFTGLGEIQEFEFIKPLSVDGVNTFVVRYISQAGQQMDLRFVFNHNMEIIDVVGDFLI